MKLFHVYHEMPGNELQCMCSVAAPALLTATTPTPGQSLKSNSSNQILSPYVSILPIESVKHLENCSLRVVFMDEVEKVVGMRYSK